MKKNPMSLALKKLSYRPYAKEALEGILIKAGFDLCEIENVLIKLQDMGYLNDESLAQDLYVYYTNHKPCGPILLREKLRQKGIPANITAAIIEDYDYNKELKLAQYLAEKYIIRSKSINIKRSLVLFLQRKGFTSDVIRNIISTYSIDKKIYLD